MRKEETEQEKALIEMMKADEADEIYDISDSVSKAEAVLMRHLIGVNKEAIKKHHDFLPSVLRAMKEDYDQDNKELKEMCEQRRESANDAWQFADRLVEEKKQLKSRIEELEKKVSEAVYYLTVLHYGHKIEGKSTEDLENEINKFLSKNMSARSK